VLTAAQQNISAATGIPVFSTTVTRDAAFGGSNKVLAEGQLCYIEASNIVQYYDGAAWATVGPASAGGLTFITGTTFSASATVSLPASTFTSTYTNYRIVFVATAFSADDSLTMRMRVSGTDNTTANYEYSIIGYTVGGTLNGIQATGQTSAIMTYGLTTGVGLGIDIYNPQATERTRFTMTSFGKSAGSGVASPLSGGGSFTATTSFDALSFISGSNMTGRYAVYGYNNS